MSIMSYNGSAVIAMAGKNCVAIASDKRYGLRNQTISCEMRKTFQVNDKTLCGLTGLARPLSSASSSAPTCTACARSAT